MAILRKENLIAYIAECHSTDASIAQACDDYGEWQSFMATRMIDDTEAQRYAHQETSGTVI